MGTQPGQVGDEKFSNWVKDTLALLYTKTCLEVIADERSAVFYGQLKTAVGNNSTCTCSWQDLTLDRRNQKWVVRNCPGVCQKWLDLIISRHSNRPLPKLAPMNTDPGRWSSDSWEVMKVYQSKGCQGHRSARDADVAALIDLMRNCNHFAPLITNPSLINQVMTLRNNLMHSKDFKVENQELSDDLQSMLSFLRSLTAIAGVSSLSATEHQAVQTATTEVDKLRTSILDMTLNRELQLRALKAKQVALETDMNLLEQTIDDATADTAAVKSGLTDVEDKLSTEVQTLQQRLASQLSKIQDVKKDMTSQQSMIQDVKKDMTFQQSKIQDVKKDMTSQQSKIQDVKKDMTSQQSKIQDVKKDMTSQQSMIQDVKKDMTSQQSMITDVKKDMTSQQSMITDVKKDMTSQQTMITDVKKDMTVQQQSTATVVSNLARLQQQFDDLRLDHDETKKNITDLKKQMSDLRVTSQQQASTITTLYQRQEATESELQNQQQETHAHANQLYHHQKEIDKHRAKLDRLEKKQIAQQTDQAVDFKGLQHQLISMYQAWIQHFPVYLLMSERKIRLEDIYVEQRLKVVDPDGRMKTDVLIKRRDRSKPDKNEKFISSLKDIFYNEGSKCQYVNVSGNAGYGKSVFCSHLVRLWCVAHSENTTELTPDEKMMTDFPLLFCLDLKDAKYDGTFQTPDEMCCLIQKQLQRAGIALTYDYLSKLLQADGQVLVVMDALDECKEQRLPRGGTCNNCTTLITSRPWKFEALRCDPECRVDKELEIVRLKKGSSEDLSKNLVKLLNKQWNKSKNSKDFIWKMRVEGVQEFLDVPVLLTSMLCLWFDDVPFGQSQVEVYRNSIHHQILAAIKAKGIPRYSCPSEVPFPVCQREKCPCKCYGELLWKVSELAGKALLGNVRERSLVMDHDQTVFLGMTDEEVAICMKLGILTQYKLLGNVTDYEPQKSVSFIHKTYQEWFAAVYLSSKLPLSELDKLLSEAIVDLDSALELDQMFLFVCGLKADFAAKLSEFIMSKVSLDFRVQEYRKSNAKYTSHDLLINNIQNVIVAGGVEAKKNNKESIALQLHDVHIKERSRRFSTEQILACDTSQAKSVCIKYIRIGESEVEKRKIKLWLESSCLDRLVLCITNNTLDEIFRFNFSTVQIVVLYLEYVTLTHAQLESLCESLATAESVRTVDICGLNCITHTDNRQECFLQLDLYQHIGLKLISFEKINQSWLQRPDVKIRSWPPSSCMETVDLRHVNISSCDTFCDNFIIDMVSKLYLDNVILAHDQLESLCGRLASAGNLRTVDIRELTCKTHQDNRQDCSIMWNLSQHQGLENLTLWDLGVGEVQGVSLCQKMDKLSEVVLKNIALSHDGLGSLCASLVTAGNLRTMDIRKLACIAHQYNRQDCCIQLDFSQYLGTTSISFEKIQQSRWQLPNVKITSWPSSSCMETVDLRRVDMSPCDTFCDNFIIDMVSKIYLENVILAHDQLESLCGRLASAGNLRTVDIRELTCKTHQDNRQDCSIILNLSQHRGLKELRLLDLGVCEVQGVSLCQKMDKLSEVVLKNIALSHDGLGSLCASLVTAGNLRTMDIRKLACIAHQYNRQDCCIQLDFSQYLGTTSISFEKIHQSRWQLPNVKITSWPSSSCMETVDLRRVDMSPCDTFCDNFIIGMVSNMYLEDVKLTHDQLESLCGSLTTAGSLRAVGIRELTCKTHQDNRHDCSIRLNLSQHRGLKELRLLDLGVGEVQGVSVCQKMDKLSEVVLKNIALSHDGLGSLCASLATAVSLRTVDIRELTCKTHQDNRQNCCIQLDFSQYMYIGTKSISFEKIHQSGWQLPNVKITSWPSSSCMETVDLRSVDISSCDTFCNNFIINRVSNMYLEDVKLTHDQLESLCGSLASARSLRTVVIRKLTCKTHRYNRHDCSIRLNLSQHRGLKELRLLDLGVCEVQGVSLCQNMEMVELCNITLTHGGLEILCGSLVTADLDVGEVQGVSLKSQWRILTTAVSLWRVNIRDLTCKTHQDNRQNCCIQLDFSQYIGTKSISFENIHQSGWQLPNVKITSWPSSSYMETVDLRSVDISSCDTFCNNFIINWVSNMYLEDVKLTHDQLESLCGSLASARSLRTVVIRKLTCITHQGNRQECGIILNFSQHQGLEDLKLCDLGVGEVHEVSLCQNMDMLSEVVLGGFCISAAALRQTLEAHCGDVQLGGRGGPLRVRGAEEARQLLGEIRGTTQTYVYDDDDVEYTGDECVVNYFCNLQRVMSGDDEDYCLYLIDKFI